MTYRGHRSLGYKGVMVSGRHLYARAGFRVPDRCRDMPNANLKGYLPQSYAKENAESDLEERGSKHDRAAEVRAKVGSRSQDLLYSWDDEDFSFFQTLRGMIDSAWQLLEADDNKKQWFIDIMMGFVSQRLETLSRYFSAKDAARAFALRLRRHVKAHDATMLALGIRAGVDRPRWTSSTNGARPPQGQGNGELEEHELQPVILWREWKRCGGYWPLHLPDPDDGVFEQPHGTDKFLSQLDDGIQVFLREISQYVLDICLPEDGEELRVSCRTATRKARARGGAGKEDMFVSETANRLVHMKSDVLEPLLCEVLTQQLVGRFCRSGKLCDLMLNILRPGTDISLFGHNLKNPETFSLMSGVLQRLGSASTNTLRTELMQGVENKTNGRQGGHFNPAAQGEDSESSESDHAAPGETSTTTIKSQRRALATEVGGNFKESEVLMGGEEGAFDRHLEEVALEGLAEYLQSEIVNKIPFANLFLSDTWVSDRVEAARAFARRPTNLMLVLSLLESAKDVLRSVGERCKDSTGVGVGCSGVGNGEELKTSERGSLRESRLNGMRTKITSRRRKAISRNTPGWRAWEARREMLFRADLGVAGLHVGRSLLGQEAIDVADRVLKALSFKYHSLEMTIGHDASKALQRCSEVDAPEMLVEVKPQSFLAILYISCQLRMLGALRHADLDFSKTPHGASEAHPLGDGSRSRVLSQRFRSYSWMFTDVLIDKLVALKVEQVEHARDLMVASTATETEDDSAFIQVGTTTSEDGEARAKRMSQEWAELKRDVMQEIAVYDSSKDLLSKVVESWLPEVLAADLRGANGDSKDRIPELYL